MAQSHGPRTTRPTGSCARGAHPGVSCAPLPTVTRNAPLGPFTRPCTRSPPSPPPEPRLLQLRRGSHGLKAPASAPSKANHKAARTPSHATKPPTHNAQVRPVAQSHGPRTTRPLGSCAKGAHPGGSYAALTTVWRNAPLEPFVLPCATSNQGSLRLLRCGWPRGRRSARRWCQSGPWHRRYRRAWPCASRSGRWPCCRPRSAG